MQRPLVQFLILSACVGGLASLAGQINHELAPLALTVSVPGLLVAYAALLAPLRVALAVAVFGGLWIDASAPVAFGRHAVILGLLVCAVHNLRERMPRHDTLVGVMVALFGNLAVFVLLSLLDLGGLPDSASTGLRLLLDLAASQLFTALAAPWFLAIQDRALALAGARPESVAARRFV